MRLLLPFLIIWFMTSCDIQDEWILDVPSFKENSQLEGAASLPDKALYAMEGIYLVIKGTETFGDTIVLKQTRDRISLFGAKEGVYVIGKAGYKGASVIIEGYWRYALNNETGLLRFVVDDVANEILQGDTLINDFIINGVFGNDYGTPESQLQIKLIERFTPRLRSDPFIIGAHRGGGRTSDRLPYSENSVEIIRFAEYLGATGIELDVQLTKDRIPVLYHDEDLNIRLVQKGPLLGKVSDYTFDQLRTFIKLLHGENLPSLEEALEIALHETQLRNIWLDVKDAGAIDKIIPIQKNIHAKAAKMGRNMDVLIGIPSSEVFDALKAHSNYREIPSLCELDPEQVSEIGAKTWAFRWTLGLMEADVMKMHAEGRTCFVWTLDIPEFIDLYVSQGKTDPSKRLDGILTDYSSLVAYYHYLRHNY